jgi:hypothetical protein
VWHEFELEGDLQLRAILEGYLVFLRREQAFSSGRKGQRGRASGEWFVHFLIPDEERERAYLAGEGFTNGVTLERAQEIAMEKAQELRGNLDRGAARQAAVQERMARGSQPRDATKSRNASRGNLLKDLLPRSTVSREQLNRDLEVLLEESKGDSRRKRKGKRR